MGEETTAEEATPTFDLAFAYVGLPDRENGTPATAVDSPAPASEVPAQKEASTWSPREAVPPPPAAPAPPVDRAEGALAVSAQPHLQSPFGPVGVRRSPLQVAVRVLASLGMYALSWQKHSNLELEAFDPNLPARQARSTRSSVVAWVTALVITVAGAVLFASARQSIHLPFGRQLTSTEAYYLIGGLACLYLIVILPFNLAAATANLRRLRLVQEHVGISARGCLPLGSARLMVIPVIGRLVLLGLEQRGINAIWNAARIADAPGVDVLVDRSATVAGEHDTGISAATEPAADTALQPAEAIGPALVSVPVGAAAGTASAELPVSSDGTAASDTAPLSTEVPATEISDELGAIFAALQPQPMWIRIAAPKPHEAAESEATADAELSADTMVTDDVDASVVDPTEGGEPAPSVAAAEPDESASVDSTPRVDPVWLHIPTPRAEDAAEPVTEPGPDFVAPRLDIDVDALRDGLNQIAVKWLGADDAAPVAAAIAAARPGVDDFVAAIASIRAMDIPGRESPIVRAMAREMHYYATEVLCAA